MKKHFPLIPADMHLHLHNFFSLKTKFKVFWFAHALRVPQNLVCMNMHTYKEAHEYVVCISKSDGEHVGVGKSQKGRICI